MTVPAAFPARLHILVALLATLLVYVSAQAQTPLRPPIPLSPPKDTPPSTSVPAASTTLSAPSGSPLAGKTIAAPQVTNIKSVVRFQTLREGNRVVDLSTARDSDVLKGKSGRTITVSRIRQLQAKLDAAPPLPSVVAKPGQKLAAVTAKAPAGTRIALPGGRTVKREDLSKLQAIRAKLDQKRVVVAVPKPTTALAQAIVGQNGVTLADALKRPGNEVIQVGDRKYTADQLRLIDQKLRNSSFEPRGLLDRGSGRAAIGNAGGKAPVIATGPRIKVAPGAKIAELIGKPDNTLLETSSGRTATVAQLKQFMAREKLTPAQLEEKFGGKVLKTETK